MPGHHGSGISRTTPLNSTPLPTHLEDPEQAVEGHNGLLRIPLPIRPLSMGTITSPGATLPSTVDSELSVGHRRAQAFSFHTSTPAMSSQSGQPAFLGLRSPGAGTPGSAARLPSGGTCHHHRLCMLRPSRVVRTLSGIASPGGGRTYCAERSEECEDRVLVPSRELCAICLEALTSGDIVQPMVRCSHLFHKACIDALLEARRGEGLLSCPTCRGRLGASSLSEMPEQERAGVHVLNHPRVPSLEATSGSLDGSGLGSSMSGSVDGQRTRWPTMLFNDL